MRALTIILSSYNRKELLKRAIDSCRNQVNQEFDLIVFDDASTDGAREYLQTMRHDPLISKMILNEANLGFSASVNAALHAVQTEWATILCDDDFLATDFVACSLATLQRTERDCVVTSHNLVDVHGKILQAFPQSKFSLDARQALAANIPIAGISGFFFRLGQHANRDLMRDYPRAFFSDTLFGMEFIFTKGLDTVEAAYYNKTIWDQSESALDTRSAKQFFEAMLRFQQDLGLLLKDYGTLPEVEAELLKTMSFPHFARVLLLPLIARGALARQDIADWYALARRYDPRYIPHCRLLALTSVIANRHTLELRSHLHRYYRQWLARRPVS